MDEIVTQAMAKWPDVPAVYGWLQLDRRGRWLIKGEPIGHRPTIEFINRNYQCDARGRWFFQNGPQRVFVDLERYPFVLWLPEALPDPAGRLSLVTHVGSRVSAACEAWIDRAGGIAVISEHGPGSVLDRDLPALVECMRTAEGCPIDEALWAQAFTPHPPALVLMMDSGDVPVRALAGDTLAYAAGFDARPRPDAGEDACS